MKKKYFDFFINPTWIRGFWQRIDFGISWHRCVEDGETYFSISFGLINFDLHTWRKKENADDEKGIDKEG